jgi:transposase
MERLHMNDVIEVLHRLRQGEPVQAIQRDTGHARKTIRKYREIADSHGLLDKEKPLPDAQAFASLITKSPRFPQCISTVEPYRKIVQDYLDRNVNMKLILRKLREDHGYTGSYSSVVRYCVRLRPSEPEAYCRIETLPGEEVQVDFGSVGKCRDISGRLRKVWVFVMTLSWSRHQYAEVVFDQKMSTWLQCHENAFRWFGGVPGRIVIDNLKAAVIKRELQDPVLSEPYRRMARHYGFLVSPNRPRTPRHKGKVENGIRYVKGSFFDGEDMQHLERNELNDRLQIWVMEEAGVRIHGTTHEQPLTRFRRTELSTLRELPIEPFDLVIAYRAKLHHDCHVVVDGRYYSAPFSLIGKTLDVYVGRRVVEIYNGTELVTTHPVSEKKGSRTTRMGHYPKYKREWLEKTPQKCRELACGIGEWCGCAVEELLSDRVSDRLPSVHSLLGLAERVGNERLNAACRRALHYGDPRYVRVKGILDAGLEELPLEDNRIIPDRGEYTYARSSASFFSGKEVL